MIATICIGTPSVPCRTVWASSSTGFSIDEGAAFLLVSAPAAPAAAVVGAVALRCLRVSRGSLAGEANSAGLDSFSPNVASAADLTADAVPVGAAD